MPSEEVVNQAKSWFKKAESDFKTIEIVLDADDEDCPFDTVCFHAQQAAEKYLKGYLVFFEIHPPKIHVLQKLVNILPEESEIPEKIGDLNQLSRFAAISRYPDDLYEFDRELAESAVNTAKHVKNVILKDLFKRGIKVDNFTN